MILLREIMKHLGEKIDSSICYGVMLSSLSKFSTHTKDRKNFRHTAIIVYFMGLANDILRQSYR